MRGLVLMVALAACGSSSSADDIAQCSDSACSPDICTRNGECDAASDVRTLHVTWTVNGLPAGAANCSSFPDLELDFISDFGDSFGFAPVPCMEGQFSIDRIPMRFTQVELGELSGQSESAFVDGNNDVMFDLAF